VVDARAGVIAGNERPTTDVETAQGRRFRHGSVDVSVADWVADEDRTGCHRCPGHAAECQEAIRLRHDSRILGPERHLGSANRQWNCAECARENDPHAGAAERDVSDLSERLILEVQ
jgi:hypothetical protein